MHRLFFLCFIPYLMVILMNGADTALLIRKFNMEMILPVITAAQIPDDYELETIKAQTIIARCKSHQTDSGKRGEGSVKGITENRKQGYFFEKTVE